MEKYSQWMDKRIGIKPFIPNESRKAGFISCLKLFMKMILFSPILLMWGLIYVIGIDIARLERSILEFMFGWQLLISLDGGRRSRFSGKHVLRENSVYVSNFTSPLDGFVISMLSAHPVMILVPRGKFLYKFTALELFWFTLHGNIEIPSNQKLVTEKDIKNTKNPIVLFAEGTASSGHSVLPFEMDEKEFSTLIKNTRAVHAINLTPTKISLCTPVAIGIWKYMNTISAEGVQFNVNLSNSLSDPTLDQLRTAMLGGERYLLLGKNLGLDAKKKFVQAWNANKKN